MFSKCSPRQKVKIVQAVSELRSVESCCSPLCDDGLWDWWYVLRPQFGRFSTGEDNVLPKGRFRVKYVSLNFPCWFFGVLTLARFFCASLLMLNICPEPSGWPLLNHGQTTSRVLSLSGCRRRLQRGSTETCDDDDIQHSFSRIAHDKKLATTPESGKSVLVEIGFGTSVLCNFLGLQQNKIQFSEP